MVASQLREPAVSPARARPNNPDLLRLWVMALAALFVAGCASNEPQGVEIVSVGSSPANRTLMAACSPVGIISTSSLPLLRIQWPLRRQEALGQVSDEAGNIL